MPALLSSTRAPVMWTAPLEKLSTPPLAPPSQLVRRRSGRDTAPLKAIKASGESVTVAVTPAARETRADWVRAS